MRSVEARCKYNAEWIRNKRHNNPAASRAYKRSYNIKVKADAFALFGSCCESCGFSNSHALQIDHKTRPTGAFNAKKQMHGSKLYRALLKGRVDICDFQLFCANCNQVKRAENNEIGINHGSQQPPQAVSQLSPQEE